MYETELSILKGLYRKGTFDSPFYRKLVNDENCFNDYDSFQKIPFMRKEHLRNTTVMQRTTTPVDDIYGFFSSSGTTGAKTFYAYSNEDKKIHELFVRRLFNSLGISNKDIGAIMAPVDTGVMAHTMMWQFTTMGASYVNCPEPSPENMIDTCENVPVTTIATRPSVVSGIMYDGDLCQRANKSNVNKLILGGGYLSEERRKLLEHVWGANCYNLLGTSEMFGPMAAECPKKEGLHYPQEYIMIEVLDPITYNPVAPGNWGIAVYTSLWHKGFPLLRYWTDDLVMIMEEACTCGCGMPRIKHKGRFLDSIKMDDRYISPDEIEDLLFSEGAIGEWKMIKEDNVITLLTETQNAFDEDVVRNELKKLLKHPVHIQRLNPFELNFDGHECRFDGF